MEKADIITTFSDQIRSLHEVDYGDFKRKISLYVRRMAEKFNPDQTRSVLDVLQQLNTLVLYNATGHIEETRARVLDLANTLESRLRLKH